MSRKNDLRSVNGPRPRKRTEPIPSRDARDLFGGLYGHGNRPSGVGCDDGPLSVVNAKGGQVPPTLAALIVPSVDLDRSAGRRCEPLYGAMNI